MSTNIIEEQANVARDTPTFGDLFNKLPTELKLQIIRYIVDETPAESHITYRTEMTKKKNNAILWLPTKCDVYQIVKEVIYSQNKFFVNLAGIGATEAFRYPPKTVNCFIRRLEIAINVRRRDWRVLQKIAEGKLGFETLNYFAVWVNATGVWPTENNRQIQAARQQITAKRLAFAVKTLVVCYDLDIVQYRNGGSVAYKARIQDLLAIKPLVFLNLSIKTKNKGQLLKETIEEEKSWSSDWKYRRLEV
jgi:hypothetical protein